MIGPAIVLGLGCLGRAVGCGIAGRASHGVMARVDKNHGKLIGMSVLPSSQAIYAFTLVLLMRQAINANTLSPASAIGIGTSVGLAVMVSSIYQGMCVATGIEGAAKEPGIYGKCCAELGIVESFSLFAFALLLLG